MMNLAKLLVIVALTVNLVSCTPTDLRTNSTVILESSYYVPVQDGYFLLFLVSPSVIELKKYPSFYFEEGIFQQGTLIKNINGKIIGYTIGSYDNYYPITMLQGAQLHCGDYDLKELVGAREIVYRGRKLKSIKHLQRKVKLYDNLKCFVHV